MAVLLEATLRDNKLQKLVFSLTFSSQHTVYVCAGLWQTSQYSHAA